MNRKYPDDDSDNEKPEYWKSYSDLMSALLLVFVLMMSATLLHSLNIYHQKIEEETKIKAELEQKALEHQELIEQIKEQSEQLEEQQAQIEKLIGLKEEIIISLSEEFAKTDLVVAVDPMTGSIAFDSSILFPTNSFELSEQGKVFLDSFIPVYFEALMHSEYMEYISEIIIEGHTDTDGDYMYNLELSQKRALSVCKYCIDTLETNQKFDKEHISRIITANGRSWSNPVYNNNGEVDKDASRRVEFKFSLKDDEMISTMKGILEND